MTDPHTPGRWRLDLAPAEALALLPSLGRVMLAAEAGGATHERIGPAEAVTVADGVVRVTGAAQDAEIALAALAGVVLDTTSVMKDKRYPRFEFTGADGAAVFSAVGMDGEEAFLAALGGGAREPVADRERDGAGPARAEAEPDDPALRELEAAAAAGAPVTLRLARPGITQRWRGTIEAIRPAMGFVNVMTPDFHLHLRAGSVAGWEAEGGWRHALTAEGVRSGLAIGPG